MKTFSLPTKLFLFSTLLAAAVECGGGDPGAGTGPGTDTGTMEMTTVQGRVADANGTQAQTYGGAGSLAARGTVSPASPRSASVSEAALRFAQSRTS